MIFVLPCLPAGRHKGTQSTFDSDPFALSQTFWKQVFNGFQRNKKTPFGGVCLVLDRGVGGGASLRSAVP